MKRSELAHLVRAASRIANDENVVIIGSQAILGTYDEHELPDRVTLSREADMAFWDDEDERKSDLVDGAIGEESEFDSTFGYYGQGVSIGTAHLPDGWEERLVKFSSDDTEPGIAWCLEPHDLALAKLVAGREKDFEYVNALLEAKKLEAEVLNGRVDTLPVAPVQKRRIKSWIEAQQRKFSRQTP